MEGERPEAYVEGDEAADDGEGPDEPDEQLAVLEF